MSKKPKTTSRSIWSGAISFGLVNIPVRLYTAIREKHLHFRTLHDQDHVPLKQKMVCPAHDNQEVHPEHMVKGYEITKNHFVVVQESELEAVAPKGGKAIEIHDFVQLSEIDPLFFDKPYHVVPKPEGIKPFKLLMQVMEQTKRVAIAKVVMWGKENLAAVRPLDQGMVLETMHFYDEVVPASSVPGHEIRATVDSREMKVALSLVDSLTTEFDPTRYHDEHRDKVLAMIAKKAEGEEVATRPPEEKTPRTGNDLMAALEASLARARGDGNGNGHATPHKSRHAPVAVARRSRAPRRRRSA